MTKRKDFKRVVRARAQRTGESYSSALRNVRNARVAGSAAASPAGSARGEPPVSASITRIMPDVRSTDVDKTVRFYTGFLGFGVRRQADEITGFVSKSHPRVEVTLNHGSFALPRGFVVEVANADDVRRLFGGAESARVRMVDDLGDDGRQFSMLDPSGHCVTIATADMRPPPGAAREGAAHTITAAPAGVTTNDLAATRSFYVDLLGLNVVWERDGRMLLRSSFTDGVDLIVSSTSAGQHTNGGAGLDLGVGGIERVESLHRAAVGNWVVIHEPLSFEQVGIRSFVVLDPSATAINVYAPLDTGTEADPG